MKKVFILFAFATLLASCSSPVNETATATNTDTTVIMTVDTDSVAVVADTTVVK